MQLKMGRILQLVARLRARGMTEQEINNLPIYIGNDDELNGIHTAWYCQEISGNRADDKDFIEMIGNGSNAEFTGRAILIS